MLLRRFQYLLSLGSVVEESPPVDSQNNRWYKVVFMHDLQILEPYVRPLRVLPSQYRVVVVLDPGYNGISLLRSDLCACPPRLDLDFDTLV